MTVLTIVQQSQRLVTLETSDQSDDLTSDFEIEKIGKVSDFWKRFQIFGKISDFRKFSDFFRFSEKHSERPVTLETCNKT